MKEPGRFGILTPRQALMLAVMFAVLGVGTVVLRRVVTNEPLFVSLAVASGAFVGAVFMVVAWRVAKRRADRNQN